MRMLLALLTSGLCISALTDLSAAQTPAATASSAAAAEQAAREEIVRRQEGQVAARRLIDQAQKLYSAGNYQDAIAKLEEAVKLLPRAKVTKNDRGRALHMLTDSYYRLADVAFRAGDNNKARTLAQKSLEYDPNNRSAEGVIVKIKKAETVAQPGATGLASATTSRAPDATPEFIAKKDQIKKLFREGKILMNSGQYDEAERRFQQILLLDPYNEDASTLLKSVSAARTDIALGAGDAMRTHRLMQVSEAWVPPISRDIQAPKSESSTGSIGREAVRQAGIMKKLNEIIIPEINYREAVVSDVITFLSEESRRLDPEKVGVNIVLSGGLTAPSTLAPTPAPPPAEGQPPASEGLEGRKITLSLRDVPLIDALKYVTTLANLKYRVESSAVIVLPVDAPEGEMVTRSYSVNPGVFRSSVDVTNYPSVTAQTTPTGGGGGGAAQSAPAVQAGPATVLPQVSIAVLSTNVRSMFAEAGVQFPTNSSFYFNDRTSIIITRNTVENLETFERILAVFNTIPAQVEIAATFVEISQNDLDELGFNWQVGSKSLGSFDAKGGSPSELFPPGSGPTLSSSEDITAGLRDSTVIQGNAVDSLLAASGFGSVGQASSQIATFRGILTNPQFQLVVKALAQKRSADLLSAPKVTTISGVQAQIRVAQEFIYPTAFTAPTAVAAAGNVGSAATAVTPSTPSAFASRPVGVVFNVTPTVGADGYTIGLTLIPQVTDFLGFINYGNNLISGNITLANDIKQPLFSTRDIMTSVVIWDGQTVVLGGLIREDVQKIDDKVPFLGDIPLFGRLFRSKTTVRTKRNLLIFVTARLIDPAGNPIHRTEAASLR